MVLATAIILSFLFISGNFLLTYLLYKRINRINLLIVFIFALILFNGIIPVFLVSEATKNSYDYSLIIINRYSALDILMYYILNIIMLISAFFGWLIIKKRSELIDAIEESVSMSLNYKTIKNLSIIFLLSSIFLYYLYSRAYGGFIYLLEYTTAIRSGTMNINNSFSFLQKFGGFSIFSSLLFSGLVLEKEHLRRDVVWLVFSILFSIYYLFSLGGRVSLISFVTVLILGYIFYRYQNKITLSLVIKTVLIVLGIILGLYYITYIFARGTSSLSIKDFFIQELSYPLASFKMVSNSTELFWFKHVILSPLYFLPQSIWGSRLGLDTASSYNTFLFTGARKGERGITGSVPLDLLSFSWLEGGVIGVVIIGLLFGLLLAILQKYINSISNKGVSSLIFSYVSVKFSVMIVNYGDTVHIIQGEFAFIIGFFILMFFLVRNSKKAKKYTYARLE